MTKKFSAAAVADTVELLQDLIRAACVNDGSLQGAQEIRSAKIIAEFLRGCGASIKIVEAAPGRASIIARVPGSDPAAPVVGLLGHLDVVPVERAYWDRDPFSGELIDGEVWGRGAVDMLFLTAAFAAQFREVARAAAAGNPPRGDLILLAVADEEAGGEHGVKWLFETQAELAEITEVIGESGGMRFGEHVAIEVGEKGSAGRRITFTGNPAHASIPYAGDGAIDVAAQALQLLQQAPAQLHLGDTWEAFVRARVADPQLQKQLLDAATLPVALPQLGAIAGYAHAVSRTTIAVTKFHAGTAHNVIPGTAQLTLDIRTLPGVDDAAVDQLLHTALAPLKGQYEIKHLLGWEATKSSAATELFAVLCDAVREFTGAAVLPLVAAGGSDCRFFRQRGIPAYGFALFSSQWSYEQYRARIHAHNERIDVESIALTLQGLTYVLQRRLTC
ncbi:M20/M25/M40 family metallo-hydrolase [Canibacter oris]|uniref:Acetylornithine deacetylase/succinyl-diaminopimelate desuccinylase-like protein n=1 Tax=Canibacter oris TaxID=1365628 RepID=A0A840DEI9_9MICO|nr:M20/M25/M40 family metallo-hydrolase [Canibacter oris]MBB4071484.1 acetylornithine deacetylase/succinyl-diaminopimelate desuccinylase-like protein [Canibacter oris]